MILSEKNAGHLIPNTSSENGRTSTGTKRAGLDLIKAIAATLSLITDGKFDDHEKTMSIVDYFFNKAIGILQKYNLLGGIDISYSSNENISAFIKKILNANGSNPGAVYQHLVGAKLELRYKGQNVPIKHHSSNAADNQTGRLGDFEIGSTVFHVTKAPNKDHRKKALENANSGYKTYLLVPFNVAGSQRDTADNEGLGANFAEKVEVFAIEQFIAQNLDEIAVFDRAGAIKLLRDLLEKYNEIVDQYENDKSIKIIIPDFGS